VTTTPSLFGSTPAFGQPAAPGGLFGAPAVTTQPAAGLFGSSTTSFAQPAGGLFGSTTAPKLGKSTVKPNIKVGLVHFKLLLLLKQDLLGSQLLEVDYLDKQHRQVQLLEERPYLERQCLEWPVLKGSL
jgi:hypothetical protein